MNYLKWSCRATFKSKLSLRSANPIPMNAFLPLSSCSLMTKYLLESDTDSTARPGYLSIGLFANNSPVILSSNFIIQSFPLATSLNLPVHDGWSKLQSAALMFIQNIKSITWLIHVPVGSIGCSRRYLINEDFWFDQKNPFVIIHCFEWFELFEKTMQITWMKWRHHISAGVFSTFKCHYVNSTKIIIDLSFNNRWLFILQ